MTASAVDTWQVANLERRLTCVEHQVGRIEGRLAKLEADLAHQEFRRTLARAVYLPVMGTVVVSIALVAGALAGGGG